MTNKYSLENQTLSTGTSYQLVPVESAIEPTLSQVINTFDECARNLDQEGYDTDAEFFREQAAKTRSVSDKIKSIQNKLVFERIKQDDTELINKLWGEHHNSIQYAVHYLPSSKLIAHEVPTIVRDTFEAVISNIKNEIYTDGDESVYALWENLATQRAELEIDLKAELAEAMSIPAIRGSVKINWFGIDWKDLAAETEIDQSKIDIEKAASALAKASNTEKVYMVYMRRDLHHVDNCNLQRWKPTPRGELCASLRRNRETHQIWIDELTTIDGRRLDGSINDEMIRLMFQNAMVTSRELMGILESVFASERLDEITEKFKVVKTMFRSLDDTRSVDISDIELSSAISILDSISNSELPCKKIDALTVEQNSEFAITAHSDESKQNNI